MLSKSFSKLGIVNSLFSILFLSIFSNIIIFKELIFYNFSRKRIGDREVNYFFLLFYVILIQLSRIPENDFAAHIDNYSIFRGYTIEFVFEAVNYFLVLLPLNFKISFTIFWLSFIYYFWWNGLKKLNLLNIEIIILSLFTPYFFMSTLHLTQQFAGIMLFIYGLIITYISNTNKGKYWGAFLISLSVFVHISNILLLPLVFLGRIKFKKWHFIVMAVGVLLLRQFDILMIFTALTSYLPSSSLVFQGINQKITTIYGIGDNAAYVLNNLVYIEASLLSVLGVIYYNKFTEILKNLFVVLIICFGFVLVFARFPILSLRFYVDFQVVKLFFYSVFFFANGGISKTLKPVGYLFLFYFLFSFMTCFDNAAFSFNGIRSSYDVIFLNIFELFNNIIK